MGVAVAGYRPPRTRFLLNFDGDPDMDGLQVRVRSLSVDGFTGLGDIARLSEVNGRNFTPEDMQLVNNLFAQFADALSEWNLEDDDGNPIPPTLEQVRKQDVVWMLRVALVWIEAIVGVPAPLEPASSGGQQSLEASIPMEPLSESPPSSLVPS